VPNRIVLLRSLCRRKLYLSRVFLMGFLAIFLFFFNLEDQVIFDQGFLPLALDTPVSNCRAAVLVLVRPGYCISPAIYSFIDIKLHAIICTFIHVMLL